MASITSDTTMKQSEWLQIGNATEEGTLKINENATKPMPGPEEVLIKVKALSINPVDWKMIEGKFGSKGDFPRGWGTDVAGTIESLGENCDDRLKVGDEVLSDAIRCGPMAEYCVVALNRVSLKPKNVSFQDCVGVSLTGLTALQAIRDHGGFKEGQRICIFGGSGGVGTAAIQLAKILGASYVSTTSTNESLCTRLGSDKVIDYKTSKDIAADLLGNSSDKKDAKYDMVFDTVGGYDHWQIGQKILKSSTGRYITICGDGISLPKMIASMFWRKFVSNFGNPGYHLFLTKQSVPDLDYLCKLMEDGKLTVVMDHIENKDNGGKIYQFNDASIVEMIAKLKTNRSKGKLLMEM